MTREPCEGEGIQVDDTRVGWGNSICPVCHGIAQVDRDARIEPHTVLVILGDEEDE